MVARLHQALRPRQRRPLRSQPEAEAAPTAGWPGSSTNGLHECWLPVVGCGQPRCGGTCGHEWHQGRGARGRGLDSDSLSRAPWVAARLRGDPAEGARRRCEDGVRRLAARREPGQWADPDHRGRRTQRDALVLRFGHPRSRGAAARRGLRRAPLRHHRRPGGTPPAVLHPPDEQAGRRRDGAGPATDHRRRSRRSPASVRRPWSWAATCPTGRVFASTTSTRPRPPYNTSSTLATPASPTSAARPTPSTPAWSSRRRVIASRATGGR